MMKFKYLFVGLLSMLLFISCSEQKEIDFDQIYGEWTLSNRVDYTGLDIYDKTVFKKDGTYQLLMISKKHDSIISSIKGGFSIDEYTNKLNIGTSGFSFIHKIIELNSKNMVLKTKQGKIIVSERIK